MTAGRPAGRAGRAVLAWLCPVVLAAAACSSPAGGYDLVIADARVLDPESGLDAVRQIGIRGGRIAALSGGGAPLAGTVTLDATGLVAAPGFIDLHAHGQDDENYRLDAMDGVTTALELEVGTEDVDRWYAERRGKALVHYGASVSHIRTRMRIFGDSGSFLPSGEGGGGRSVATAAQIEDLKARLQAGLDQGALGIGMGLQYTPGATRWEVLEAFRLAAERGAPVFVHVRSFGTVEPGSSVESFEEVIGAAAITGAPLHIVHLNSMSLGSTPLTLQMVREARGRGLDLTTEAYPYSAGMTEIESALLDQYEQAPDSLYRQLQWVATGERLTRATFHAYRKQGGLVILHLNTPAMEALAIESPLTAIASDGLIAGGKGHPRTAGTYARVLGHYVRETRTLTLMEAVRKMALLPAQRLERRAPIFRTKGRLAVGADADIAVFDPATVTDRATYEHPAEYSLGFRYVLVGGVPVVRDGRLVEGVYPGRPARAPAPGGPAPE